MRYLTQHIMRMASEILIRGMVCGRCIAVIRQGITNLGHDISTISLGKITLSKILTKDESVTGSKPF